MIERPTFSADEASLLLPTGESIPWDSANNRPVDYACEAGRKWEAAKVEFGITEPDPYVAPPPPPVVYAIRSIALARFTVALNAVTVTTDSMGVGAVTRISAGRFRIYPTSPPAQTMLPKVTYVDVVERRQRVSARTGTYVEVRFLDTAGVAADPQEVIVEIHIVVAS